MTQDERRALRAIVQAVIILAFTWFVWTMADRTDPRWLIGVIAISVIGGVVENGIRSLKISAGKEGFSASVEGEDDV